MDEFNNSSDVETSEYQSTTYSINNGRKTRVKFSKEDNTLIMNSFGMLITGNNVIRTSVMQEKINGNELLLQLVKKFDLDTIVAKIRTERKKFLKQKF